MQELVEEGIVPEAAVKQEDGDAVYDEQEVGRALQEYADRISCSPTMISGNNMIIEVRNGNDVTIPMVTVHVNYPDGEKTYNFYQFAPGGTIIVPVEKDDGDLPPAVTASVSVTMNANSRTDISDSLAVEESMTDTSYTLTITNHSSFACQNISVTALFSDDSGIICAQTASSDETVLSGKSTQLTFTPLLLLPLKSFSSSVPHIDLKRFAANPYVRYHAVFHSKANRPNRFKILLQVVHYINSAQSIIIDIGKKASCTQ